jgi:hypothetical protein
VTLIKTTNGNLFGGYTALPWDSSNTYKVDKNAFIYSLVNKKKQPFIAKSNRNPTGSIYCSVSNGPVFGNSNGYDLKIVSDSNSNTNSSSSFKYSYEHPCYPYGSNAAKSILDGAEKFQTVEIEVFRLN